MFNRMVNRMNNSSEPQSSSRLLVSTIRAHISRVYLGPMSVSFEWRNQPFWGWPVLSLGIRRLPEDWLESRTVYANPFDKTQRWALLRAITWDRIMTRQIIESEQEHALRVPAKFVVVSQRHLDSWLQEFDGVNILVRTAAGLDYLGEVRRIRIELNYATSIFEKLWQTDDAEYTKLNMRWSGVWQNMTNVLRRKSAYMDFSENFRDSASNVEYAFDEYRPDGPRRN
jgi:hypothetical protein